MFFTTLHGGMYFMLNDKLVSFSLWGDDDFYCFGAIHNSVLMKSIYPEWKMIVFHDSTVPDVVLQKLAENDVILRKMSDKFSFYSKAMWRFLAIDMTTEPVIFRDSDSRISNRERHIVERWLHSDKMLHTIREKGHYKLIQAGMFGLKDISFSMEESIARWLSQNDGRYGKEIDEYFLEKTIWPLLADNNMTHIGHESSRKNIADILIDEDLHTQFGTFIGEKIYEWPNYN